MTDCKPELLDIEEVARLVGGEVVNAQRGLTVRGLTTLEEADADEVSFIAVTKHATGLEKTKAALLLIPEDLDPGSHPAVKVDNVWRGVKIILEHFHPQSAVCEKIDPGAHIAEGVKRGANLQAGPGVVIEEGAVMGDNVRLGAGCFIGARTRIGDNTLLEPNVSVMHDCMIGARVVILSGAVIGSEGFKYEEIDGVPTKIPQVGRVVIEDDVEIGANVTIDRASFTETLIGRGTKIDNLVQIAHNCRIGRYCIICSQVGISGSTELGDGCILAGQVGLADNLKLGNRVILAAQSGLMHNVPDGETWFGYPAQPIAQTMKLIAHYKKLPQMKKDLLELKKSLPQT